MPKINRRSGLGRGLSSLLGESIEETAASEVEDQPADNTVADQTLLEQAPKEASIATPAPAQSLTQISSTPENRVDLQGGTERATRATDEIPLASISPNPHQPRTNFKPEEIDELAASIEKEGLLQPIVVRRVGSTFQIIAGERRWHACSQLGLETVPVRIIEASDDKAIELALIENIQRSDLNPIEEARAYKRLMDQQGMTQAQIADAVAKGRSTIANALRLLELPESAQQLLYEEKITAGHARAILSIPTAEGRQELADRLAEGRLSVRETEDLARAIAAGNADATKRSAPAPLPAAFKQVATSLKDRLQTNVRIKSGRKTHKIEIEFKDENELQRLFKHLMQQ